MRQHLLRFNWAVIPLAVVIIVFAWMRTYRTIVPAKAGDYYYDLSTGDLFVAAGGPTGVVDSPAGNEAVKAAVYACGDCNDETNRFVAYLEKATPEAIEQLSRPMAERTDPGAIDSGMWVSLPDTPPQWIIASSPQAQMIRDAPYGQCAATQQQAVRCGP
jgi:hypothetical protein